MEIKDISKNTAQLMIEWLNDAVESANYSEPDSGINADYDLAQGFELLISHIETESLNKLAIKCAEEGKKMEKDNKISPESLRNPVTF